jgi:hypothetical protein
VGCAVDDAGSGQLRVYRRYTCEFAGRTVDLSGGTTLAPHEPGKELHKRDPSKPIPDSHIGVIGVDQMVFYAYGTGSDDRSLQRDAYKAAVRLIQDHFKQYYTKRKPLHVALLAAISGYNIQDYYGKSYSQLPTDVQDQLRSSIIGQYQQLGFPSRDAAAAAASQLSLIGSTAQASLDLGYYSGNSTIGMGIE